MKSRRAGGRSDEPAATGGRIHVAPSPPSELEAEDDEPETGPLRRCIVTRERLPKERMIRFVVGPDGAIVPDLAATAARAGNVVERRGMC